MKTHLKMASLALVSIIASTGLAQATDYVITWKNQFASTTTCTLNASAVSLAGTIPNNIQHSFTGLGQTVQATLSSPGCTRISISATCKYTDSQGSVKRNSFGTASEPCGNYVVTLNPTIPGSFTILPGSGKRPLGM